MHYNFIVYPKKEGNPHPAKNRRAAIEKQRHADARCCFSVVFCGVMRRAETLKPRISVTAAPVSIRVYVGNKRHLVPEAYIFQSASHS